jgi:hypothetical protein
VGHYVKDRTKDAQFIIIRLARYPLELLLVTDIVTYAVLCLIFNAICSLRNNMFELADRLVRIYKTDNCTKSITLINPGSFMVSEKAILS